MARTDVSQQQKLAFLRSPAAYGEPRRPVEVKETHLSWLFLTPTRVYKLKKPLRTGPVDFRSLAARERNAREEVRLNRRLAAEVYLGVVPLTQEASGALALSGSGRPVDWLVEMRRLPERLMLDQLVQSGRARPEQIEALAARLVSFYRALPSASPSPPTAYRELFATEQSRSARMLRRPRFGLEGVKLSRILARVSEVPERQPELIDLRVASGCVVEGHGDLRPEHVCCLDPPVVIDCLEFSRALRLVDPYDEIIYLSLECSLLGSPWIRELLLQRLTEGIGNPPSLRLLDFYWGYRACLRARQALAHLHAPAPRNPQRWLPLARRYLDLAEAGVTFPVPASR